MGDFRVSSMGAGIVSRRRFMGAAIAGALGARGSGAEKFVFASGGPTLGFNTYGMKSVTTEEAMRELAKIGYDSVQLDCTAGCDADPGNLSAARRVEIRRLAGDLGLKLTAIQGAHSPTVDEKKHVEGIERLKVLAQLVHDLDAQRPPIIEIGLGGRDAFEKMKPLFVRRVAEWMKIADAMAVRIVVKPHRDTSMDRPEQAVELFKELGTPARLRMSFDYSHFALRDMPLADAIRVALPWTGFVAIKDVATENGKAVFKLPGETKAIDYALLVRQFHEGGYRGDYNCEISSMVFKKPGFDCLAAARTSYANIAPAFDAAGVKRV